MAFRASASKMTEDREERVGEKTSLRAYSYKTQRHDRKTHNQMPVDSGVKSVGTNLMNKHGCRFRLSAFRSLGASQPRHNTEQCVRSPADYELDKLQQFPDASRDDHRLLQRRNPAYMTSAKHRDSDQRPVFPSRGSLFPAPDISVPFQHRLRRTVVFRSDAPDVVNIVSREPTIHFGARVVRSDVTRRNRVYPLPSAARRSRPKSILKSGQWSHEGNTDTNDNRHEVTRTVRYSPDIRQSYIPCRETPASDASPIRYRSDSVCTIGSDRDEKSDRKHRSPVYWATRTPEISELRLPVIGSRLDKSKSYSRRKSGSTSSEESRRPESRRFACSNEFASALHTLDTDDVFYRNSPV